jgi:hypothetical protein
MDDKSVEQTLLLLTFLLLTKIILKEQQFYGHTSSFSSFFSLSASSFSMSNACRSPTGLKWVFLLHSLSSSLLSSFVISILVVLQLLFIRNLEKISLPESIMINK